MNEVITPKSISPKWLPVKCVVCQGWGSFSHGKIACQSCGGTGYIKVEPKEEHENQTEGGENT